jgi:hypothetical protein
MERARQAMEESSQDAAADLPDKATAAAAASAGHRKSRRAGSERPERRDGWDGVFQRALLSASAMVTCETQWLFERLKPEPSTDAEESGGKIREECEGESLARSALKRRLDALNLIGIAAAAAAAPATSIATGGSASASAGRSAPASAAKPPIGSTLVPRIGTTAEATSLLAELTRVSRSLCKDHRLESTMLDPQFAPTLARLVSSFDVTEAPLTAATLQAEDAEQRVLTTPQWRALTLCVLWVTGQRVRASGMLEQHQLSHDELQSWGRAAEATGLEEHEFRHLCWVLRGGIIGGVGAVGEEKEEEPGSAGAGAVRQATERAALSLPRMPEGRLGVIPRGRGGGGHSEEERARVAEARLRQALSVREQRDKR